MTPDRAIEMAALIARRVQVELDLEKATRIQQEIAFLIAQFIYQETQSDQVVS